MVLSAELLKILVSIWRLTYVRLLAHLSVPSTEVGVRSLSQASILIYLLVTRIHGLAQLVEIWTPVLVNLPLGVGYDFFFVLGVHDLQMAHVESFFGFVLVDVAVYAGFCFFHVAWIWRWASYGEGSETGDPETDALWHVCVVD